ncbi:hypothetical protein MKL09_05130 [Methylobacterium sp. J-048]|uniref:hypothetical protein n=1 Tax=Methylobacterium sp. J-048 TaxID=2836635 RepID=UPI001FBA32F1|nr:hypothetical protein [Methylobacterium sp. J-048]MCJ2055932.1 hypothetical protein [Methylobacterium sp. J-048]
MRLILAPLAWWNLRRVRRATRDMRLANFYATRSLRTLIAVGLAPLEVTSSGVPAVPAMPLARR